MPIYNSPIAPKQITQSRLIEPHRLVFKAHVQPNGFVRPINDDLILFFAHDTNLPYAPETQQQGIFIALVIC